MKTGITDLVIKLYRVGDEMRKQEKAVSQLTKFIADDNHKGLPEGCR